MYIDGYAYKAKEREIREERQKIYDTLDMNIIRDVKVQHARGKNIYFGSLNSDISEYELALLLDGGSMCFGGKCEIQMPFFSCTVYTD